MRFLRKALCFTLTFAMCLTTVLTGIEKKEVRAAGEAQYALWPMDVVYFTQKIGGDYSHKGTLNFDIVGETKQADVKAPFDAKVVAIFKKENEGNTVVIQSIDKVKYADGTTDIMCMSFGHDNDVSDLYVGKILKQGEVFYQTGTYGYVTGDHTHVNCFRGEYKSGEFWVQNVYGNYCPNNAISPEKALFIKNSTKVIQTFGLEF